MVCDINNGWDHSSYISTDPFPLPLPPTHTYQSKFVLAFLPLSFHFLVTSVPQYYIFYSYLIFLCSPSLLPSLYNVITSFYYFLSWEKLSKCYSIYLSHVLKLHKVIWKTSLMCVWSFQIDGKTPSSSFAHLFFSIHLFPLVFFSFLPRLLFFLFSSCYCQLLAQSSAADVTPCWYVI